MGLTKYPLKRLEKALKYKNTYYFATACRHSLPNLKKQTNSIIANQYLSKFNQQAEESPFQAEFINIMQQEKIDVTLKSYIYSVPREVMCSDPPNSKTPWATS